MRKLMMGFMFVLVAVIGINVGTINVKAATTKNFKGNLNATYKSGVDSKIIIKKVDNKKVRIRIFVGGNLDQGEYSGKVISKNTIQVNLDGEKVKLKWKDKTHFTAKRPSGGFSKEAGQMVRLLCESLDNVKYTQVKKSKSGNNAVAKITKSANSKNASYYVDCTGVKSLKKSKGKLTVTAKKSNPLSYKTSKGTRYTTKISYNLDKKCKWTLSSPDGMYTEKSSYKEIKKTIKAVDEQCVLTVKVKNRKIVRVNISMP